MSEREGGGGRMMGSTGIDGHPSAQYSRWLSMPVDPRKGRDEREGDREREV